MGLSKKCKECGGTFYKETTCSMKRWNSVRKFCSTDCLFSWRRNNPQYKLQLDLEGLAKGHMKGNTHGFQKGHTPWNWELKGIHLSPSTEFKEGQLAGDRHPNWQGGITPILARLRVTPVYRRWRHAVLERDDHTCQECGATEKLHADHIKPFAYFPELRYEVSNGRILCEDCHKKTDTYGMKARLQVI